MTDEWLSNIDSGNVTGLIYIDLRKAFDTVTSWQVRCWSIETILDFYECIIYKTEINNIQKASIHEEILEYESPGPVYCT